MADLGSAIEKLKEMMATPDGQANIQNIVANFGGGNNIDTSNIAGMLGNFASAGSSDNDSYETYAEDVGQDNNADNFGGFDPEMMAKMQKMMSMMGGSGGGAGGIGGSNRHANMLNSLKPYLSHGRRGKLDMAAKMMSFAKFAPMLKDL